jgi:uncharacterized membrane protein
MELSDLTIGDYSLIFAYLFLPILIFGLLIYIGIIFSNRLGRKNKLIVFFVRVIFCGGVIFALAYYYNWFLTTQLVG